MKFINFIPYVLNVIFTGKEKEKIESYKMLINTRLFYSSQIFYYTFSYNLTVTFARII